MVAFFALEAELRQNANCKVQFIYMQAMQGCWEKSFALCCLSNGFKSCPVHPSNESLNSGIIRLPYRSFLPAHCDPACRGLSYYCAQSFSPQGLSFKIGCKKHLRNTRILYPASRQDESPNSCEERVQKCTACSDIISPALLHGDILVILLDLSSVHKNKTKM